MADSSLVLPYGELLSAVSNRTLSVGEIHKLMEVLNQKAGVHQDSWQLVDKHSHNSCNRLNESSSFSLMFIRNLKLLSGLQVCALTYQLLHHFCPTDMTGQQPQCERFSTWQSFLNISDQLVKLSVCVTLRPLREEIHSLL